MDNGESKRINSVREVKVYQLGFDTAMEIFDISKGFPSGEKYSLTDQIRRSSRSVCSNLAEAWRKRRYSAVFINKLTDAEQEAAETQTWLEFALNVVILIRRHLTRWIKNMNTFLPCSLRWNENLKRSAGNKRIIFRPSSVIFRPSWTARLTSKGQVMLEFTFCMIILFLMMYAIIMVFRWTGLDLGQRRAAHDAQITTAIVQRYGNIADGPLKQIDPYFYSPTKMNAVWTGD